jgi:G:T-mismatch repair DNA endonuclease (very short patch repair protein)
MEKCKWSYFIFGCYFQYTENKIFKIIGKNKEEQWVDKIVVSLNWL